METPELPANTLVSPLDPQQTTLKPAWESWAEAQHITLAPCKHGARWNVECAICRDFPKPIREKRTKKSKRTIPPPTQLVKLRRPTKASHRVFGEVRITLAYIGGSGKEMWAFQPVTVEANGKARTIGVALADDNWISRPNNKQRLLQPEAELAEDFCCEHMRHPKHSYEYDHPQHGDMRNCVICNGKEVSLTLHCRCGRAARWIHKENVNLPAPESIRYICAICYGHRSKQLFQEFSFDRVFRKILPTDSHDLNDEFLQDQFADSFDAYDRYTNYGIGSQRPYGRPEHWMHNVSDHCPPFYHIEWTAWWGGRHTFGFRPPGTLKRLRAFSNCSPNDTPYPILSFGSERVRWLRPWNKCPHGVFRPEDQDGKSKDFCSACSPIPICTKHFRKIKKLFPITNANQLLRITTSREELLKQRKDTSLCPFCTHLAEPEPAALKEWRRKAIDRIKLERTCSLCGGKLPTNYKKYCHDCAQIVYQESSQAMSKGWPIVQEKPNTKGAKAWYTETVRRKGNRKERMVKLEDLAQIFLKWFPEWGYLGSRDNRDGTKIMRRLGRYYDCGWTTEQIMAFEGRPDKSSVRNSIRRFEESISHLLTILNGRPAKMYYWITEAAEIIGMDAPTLLFWLVKGNVPGMTQEMVENKWLFLTLRQLEAAARKWENQQRANSRRFRLVPLQTICRREKREATKV
jgi:hypothetical protein